MSMLDGISDIRKGMALLMNGQPYLVLESQFLRMQQRKPVMQTKMRNLIDGKTMEYSFKIGERVEEADLMRAKAQFLYKTDSMLSFMNTQNYEQFDVPVETLGDKIKFLKEGTECDVLYFEGNPVSVALPIKVTLKVISAPPATRGNSQGNITKQVTLETNAEINAPMFIESGEEIIINTDTEEYVERAGDKK